MLTELARLAGRARLRLPGTSGWRAVRTRLAGLWRAEATARCRRLAGRRPVGARLTGLAVRTRLAGLAVGTRLAGTARLLRRVGHVLTPMSQWVVLSGWCRARHRTVEV